ncbi:hypothetical protein BYT27DRAFT_7257372 [Phlegmacium glaucopus]|nr:hypothetical protein BYT27DRAFT_7257372 [Phlegmacium glaucopus]
MYVPALSLAQFISIALFLRYQRPHFTVHIGMLSFFIHRHYSLPRGRSALVTPKWTFWLAGDNHLYSMTDENVSLPPFSAADVRDMFNAAPFSSLAMAINTH